MSGAGAAGTAILKLFLHAGARHVVVTDVDGIIHREPADVLSGEHPNHAWIAENTNPDGLSPAPSPTRWSAPTSSSASRRPTSSPRRPWRRWRPTASSSRWPTPPPRSTPSSPPGTPPSSPPAAPTSRTRSTTCSSSPASSAASSTPASRTSRMDVMLAAADALAGVVQEDERNATYIVPSVFHPDVTTVVADAVKAAVAGATGGVSARTGPRRRGRPWSSRSSSSSSSSTRRRARRRRRFPTRTRWSTSRCSSCRCAGGARDAAARCVVAAVFVGHAVVSEVVQATLLPLRSGTRGTPSPTSSGWGSGVLVAHLRQAVGGAPAERRAETPRPGAAPWSGGRRRAGSLGSPPRCSDAWPRPPWSQSATPPHPTRCAGDTLASNRPDGPRWSPPPRPRLVLLRRLAIGSKTCLSTSEPMTKHR